MYGRVAGRFPRGVGSALAWVRYQPFVLQLSALAFNGLKPGFEVGSHTGDAIGVLICEILGFVWITVDVVELRGSGRWQRSLDGWILNIHQRMRLAEILAIGRVVGR